MDPLARALRTCWRVDETAADEVVTIPEGTVLRCPAFPDAWSVNAVRLERPEPDLRLADAEALAARHVPAVPYRHVLVEDEPTALRLTAEAGRTPGWKADVELVMGLEDPPPVPGRHALRAGDVEEVLELLAVWLTEEGHPPATVEQIVARSRREHRAFPEHHVLADHLNAPAAMATARLAGDVAQVEDVYAVPDVRGIGLGRAVTAAAARIAADSGADLVFIVADDDDWPKDLYASLGFAPLGRRVQLHREPD